MKVNVLTLGPIGTGKTYALRTFLEAEIDLAVLSLEPGIAATLGDTDDKHVHWHYIKPGNIPWDVLQDGASLLNRLPIDAVIKASQSGANKQEYNQFLEVYASCAEFKCDRCGKNLGAVDSWGEDMAFAIDGMTGLSRMAMQCVAGAAPIRTQPQWYAAQGLIENFLVKCTGDLSCSFVLISHIDREIDEVRGGQILTVQTLGRKLAPKIPPMFDEVIYTRREGSRFLWSTTDADIDLKSRRLPFSNEIAPTYAQLFPAAEPIPEPKKNGKRK